MYMVSKLSAAIVREELTMRRRRGEKIWIFFLDAHKNKAQQAELNLKQLVTQFKYVLPKPGYVVAFCSSILSEKQLCDVNTIISSQVPESCKCFSIEAKGVIVGPPRLCFSELDGQAREDAIGIRQNHSELAAATLFIPKATGLKIENIPDLDHLSDSKSKIKAILFFADMDFLTNQTLNNLFRNSKVPVVGGVVKSFLPNDVKKKLAYQYLSLSGRNVKVKSFVIKRTTQLKDDFRKAMQKKTAEKKQKTKSAKDKAEREKIKEEEELGKMEQKSKEEVEQKKKNGNEKKRFMFALMFSSMNNKKSKHVSIAFKEVFPNVPLLGLVMEKPIGFTCRQKTHSTKNQLKIYSDPTAVFLLVTVTYLDSLNGEWFNW